MISFMERATQLVEPKDLPNALHQIAVLKAIIGHVEAQLHDALGRAPTLEGVWSRREARELLQRSYAAQRALGELGHTAQLAGVALSGAGHPMPEALGLASRVAAERDDALMNYLFPVPEDAVEDMAEVIPTPAQVAAAKDVVLGYQCGEDDDRNVYLDSDAVAEELVRAVLKAGS